MMLNTQLTADQKLKALALKFYSGYVWVPKEGDYYTSSRDDLELYRVIKIEDGKIYTEYCGKTCPFAEWDVQSFTNVGFGVHRVHVPNLILEMSQGAKHTYPNHNTSCTYQFELAFHNMQDTPELRKLYWSALGQLQFDSNDRVIPPELEECPCCKQPIIRKIGTETEGYESYDIGVDESGSRYIRYRHGKRELEQ